MVLKAAYRVPGRLLSAILLQVVRQNQNPLLYCLEEYIIANLARSVLGALQQCTTKHRKGKHFDDVEDTKRAWQQPLEGIELEGSAGPSNSGLENREFK